MIIVSWCVWFPFIVWGWVIHQNNRLGTHMKESWEGGGSRAPAARENVFRPLHKPPQDDCLEAWTKKYVNRREKINYPAGAPACQRARPTNFFGTRLIVCQITGKNGVDFKNYIEN